MDVALPPDDKVTEAEDKETAGPLGEMLAERLTVPVKPPVLATVILDDPEPPGTIWSVVGLDAIVKSGGAGWVTVMSWLADAVAPAASWTVSWTVKIPGVE